MKIISPKVPTVGEVGPVAEAPKLSLASGSSGRRASVAEIPAEFPPVAVQIAQRVAQFRGPGEQAVRQFLWSMLSEEDPEVANVLMDELFSGGLTPRELADDTQIARGEAILANAPGNWRETVAFPEDSELSALRFMFKEASTLQDPELVSWLLCLGEDGECTLPAVFVGSESRAVEFSQTAVFQKGAIWVNSVLERGQAQMNELGFNASDYVAQAAMRLAEPYSLEDRRAIGEQLGELVDGLTLEGASTMLYAIEHDVSFNGRFLSMVALGEAKKQGGELFADAEHVTYYPQAEQTFAEIDALVVSSRIESGLGDGDAAVAMVHLETSFGTVIAVVRSSLAVMHEIVSSDGVVAEELTVTTGILVTPT